MRHSSGYWYPINLIFCTADERIETCKVNGTSEIMWVPFCITWEDITRYDPHSYTSCPKFYFILFYPSCPKFEVAKFVSSKNWIMISTFCIPRVFQVTEMKLHKNQQMPCLWQLTLWSLYCRNSPLFLSFEYSILVGRRYFADTCLTLKWKVS